MSSFSYCLLHILEKRIYMCNNNSNTINIMTTRFNNDTWLENCRYRERLCVIEKEPLLGCIYGPSRQMSEKISPNSLVFVVEMNNSTNKIEGIGLIRNCLQHDRRYNVYEIGNYNRYTYRSKYRVDRNRIPEQLVAMFDHILFKEKTHSKRGCGFTRIPPKLFAHEMCASVGTESFIKDEIRNTFKRQFETDDVV